MKTKKAFALFITISLILSMFLFTYAIVERNVFLSNLNKLKYMNLQANIHFDYVEKYIQEHTKQEIEKLQLKDDRFNLQIESKEENNKLYYYVIIEAKDAIPVRLSEIIIK